jgi:hypothetical protein
VLKVCLFKRVKGFDIKRAESILDGLGLRAKNELFCLSDCGANQLYAWLKQGGWFRLRKAANCT